MYARIAKTVRGRNPIRMNRSLVGIPFLGARNPHCPEYPQKHKILVGITGSGDSGQWQFRAVGIPDRGDSGRSGDSGQWGVRTVGIQDSGGPGT